MNCEIHPSTLAIIKFPGYSKLELDEAQGNNPADQAAKTAALSSTETKALIANIDSFPKEDLNLIVKGVRAKASHRENFIRPTRVVFSVHQQIYGVVQTIN